jgi:hypothetical protein
VSIRHMLEYTRLQWRVIRTLMDWAWQCKSRLTDLPLTLLMRCNHMSPQKAGLL